MGFPDLGDPDCAAASQQRGDDCYAPRDFRAFGFPEKKERAGQYNQDPEQIKAHGFAGCDFFSRQRPQGGLQGGSLGKDPGSVARKRRHSPGKKLKKLSRSVPPLPLPVSCIEIDGEHVSQPDLACHHPWILLRPKQDVSRAMHKPVSSDALERLEWRPELFHQWQDLHRA